MHLLVKGFVPPNFREVDRSLVHTVYADGPFRINVYHGPDTPERRKQAVEVYEGGYVTGEGEGAVLAAHVSNERDCSGVVYEKPRRVQAKFRNGRLGKDGMRFGRPNKSRRQCLLSRAVHLQKEKLRLRHDRAERCGFLDPATNAYPGVYTTSV